jgi:hypothetical protein
VTGIVVHRVNFAVAANARLHHTPEPKVPEEGLVLITGHVHPLEMNILESSDINEM